MTRECTPPEGTLAAFELAVLIAAQEKLSVTVDTAKQTVRFAPGQFSDQELYSPADNWEQAGPLIEKYRICLRVHTSGLWYAMTSSDLKDHTSAAWYEWTCQGGLRYGYNSYEVHKRRARYPGETPTLAAMRAVVGTFKPTYQELT